MTMFLNFFQKNILKKNPTLSMSRQTTCPKIIRDMHLWGQKRQMTTTKKQQNNYNFESLYFMFANHHIYVIL